MVSTSSCQAASIIPSHILCPDHKTLPVPQISSLHFASLHPWMGVPVPAITQRCFSLSEPVTLKCLPPWFIHSSTSICFRNTCGASSASWTLEIQLHGIDGPSVPPHFRSSCLVTSLKHPQAQSNSLSSSQPPLALHLCPCVLSTSSPMCPLSLPMLPSFPVILYSLPQQGQVIAVLPDLAPGPPPSASVMGRIVSL